MVIHPSPVFIVGLPRTASKWLQNALNTYTECCVLHEMHLLSLWHRAARRPLRRAGRGEAGDPDAMAELCLSGRLFGSFWTATDHEYTVFRLDAGALRRGLAGVEDERDLLTALMRLSCERYGKPRPGARHPVHFSHLPTLLRWFPDARVLFLTRGRRAIVRSRLAKLRQRRGLSSPATSAAIRLQGAYESAAAARLRARCAGDPRILPVRYEELVAAPEAGFGEICRHLGVAYDPRMAARGQRFDSAYARETSDVPAYDVRWRPRTGVGGPRA